MGTSDSHVESLRRRPAVDAVLSANLDPPPVVIVVFGSAARDEETDRSDFDLLVVVPERTQRAEIQDRFRELFPRMSPPLTMTPESLLSEARRRPSFVAHLLAEGIEVFETASWQSLRRELTSLAADRAALREEISTRAQALAPFEHVERFRNSQVTACSHLYSIARSLVVARLLEEGVQEFRWTRAFDRYADLHPERRADVERLKALRPYYELARARTNVEPRMVEPPLDDELVRSVARLAG